MSSRKRIAFAPSGVVSHHGIEDDQQFPHAGCQGDLFGFPFGHKTLVEVADHGVVPGSDQGPHVEGGPDGSATAPDHSLSAQCAAVLGQRRNADQRGDLLPVECAQFGKVGQESATDDGTDAGDAAQEVLLGTPHRALLDGLVQVGVDVGQASLQPTDVLFEAFFHRRERMGETIPFGDQHFDELAVKGNSNFTLCGN
jgi:hypothetical protein